MPTTVQIILLPTHPPKRCVCTFTCIHTYPHVFMQVISSGGGASTWYTCSPHPWGCATWHTRDRRISMRAEKSHRTSTAERWGKIAVEYGCGELRVDGVAYFKEGVNTTPCRIYILQPVFYATIFYLETLDIHVECQPENKYFVCRLIGEWFVDNHLNVFFDLSTKI